MIQLGNAAGGGLRSGAVFNRERTYRYWLWRVWHEPPRLCVFVGLNPSTADETTDDQTIRKEIGFAKRWGFGGLVMANLFALVSTDPKGLLHVRDPVGPDNDDAIVDLFAGATRIVWAWGSYPTAVGKLVRARLEVFRATTWRTIPPTCEVGTLGHTADGQPRHPSRLAYATPFAPERGG